MKNRKTKRATRRQEEAEEIIRLEDLAPREEPKGGARKKLFGQVPPAQRGRPRD